MPSSRSLPILLLLFTTLTPFTAAFQNLTLSKPSCIDPSGFATCRQAATTAAKSCYASTCAGAGTCDDENNCTSPDEACTEKCACGAYEGWISCALEYCWNAVYTCEYMNLLIAAERNCPTAGVGVQLPYFAPATDGSTPASCSCDIYAVFETHRKAEAYEQTCWLQGGNTTDSRRDCECCAASEGVSTFFNLCPTTAPSAIPYLSLTSPFLSPSYVTLTSSSCVSAFSANLSCPALNYSTPGPAGSQFYTPANLPANGTESLSDRPGTVTSPVGGATLVWTFASGTTVTVTAGTAKAAGTGTGKGGKTTATTTATVTAGGTAVSGTGSSSSTSSGAVASSTKASSADGRNGGIGLLVLVGAVMGVLIL